MSYIKHSLLFIFFASLVSVNAQWQKINDIDLGPTARSSTHNNVIFIYGNEVIRSQNDGSSFENITNNFPDDVYEIHSHNGELFAISGINNIYVSSDNGNSWILRSSVSISTGNGAILMLVSDGSVLYAISNRASIFRSTDNGKNWTEIVVPFSGGELGGLDFAAVNDTWVFVSILSGAFVSKDGGNTWTQNNPSIVIGSVNSFNGEIYASSSGIYKLDSNGNWVQSSNGIPIINNDLYATVKGWANAGNMQFVFVQTLFEGFIYFSNDDGNSWSEFNSSLPAFITTGNYDFITSSNNKLIAYLYGIPFFAPNYTGIYEIELSTTDVENRTNNLLNDFTLAQNFPNPFNPFTIIEYIIPESEFVSLKVYDLVGNEISTLVNEVKNSGIYRVQFEASKLSSGVYLYQLTAGNIIQTKKMLLLK